MNYSTTAIYEKGAFKLIKPLKGIPEHAMVRINVETVAPLSKKEKLKLLAAVPVAEELAAAIEEGRKRPWIVDEF